MVGRGVYGKPWIAAQIEAELAGRPFAEPDAAERLAIALDHFRDSLISTANAWACGSSASTWPPTSKTPLARVRAGPARSARGPVPAGGAPMVERG
jgi:hypothetical protein